MRWERPTFTEKLAKVKTWHQAFAFWPIEVSPGKYVWLEKVWRRAQEYRGEDKYKHRTFLFGYTRMKKSHEPALLYWEYKADTLEFLKEQ